MHSKVMSDKCVVTFAKGFNFLKGLSRLEDKCKELNLSFEGFTEYPQGCPDHNTSPFAFKFFCINECLKKGYKKILWLDCSVIIKSNLDDVYRILDDQGYFFIKNWHSLGEYCHDKALEKLNLTRDESFSIPCLQGTNFGLNFNFDFSHKFLKKLIELSLDGITFPGPYDNKTGLASKDNRVAGHRHDQIAMSAAALHYNMNRWFTCGETPWFIHDRSYVKNVDSTVTDVNMSL